MKTLKHTPIGSTVRVVKIHGEGAVRRRIMDMGITKGVEIFAKPGSNIEGNIVKNIAALGFTNRGVKSNGFAVINTARS